MDAELPEPHTDAAIARGECHQHARLDAGAQQQMSRDRSLLIEGIEYAAFGDPELQRRGWRRCSRGYRYEQESERQPHIVTIDISPAG